MPSHEKIFFPKFPPVDTKKKRLDHSYEYLFKNRLRKYNGIGNESVSLGLDTLLLTEETDSNTPSHIASTINTQIVLTIKDGQDNDR